MIVRQGARAPVDRTFINESQYRWYHWALAASGCLVFLALDRLPNPTNWIIDNTWATIHALIIAAVIMVPLVIYASHDSANEFLASLLSKVTLLYPLLAGLIYGMLVVCNIHFDRGSPPRRLVLRVLSRQTDMAGLRNRITVESWNVKHVSELLTVDEEHVFRALVPDETNVQVTLKPGRLGYLWLRSIRVEPPLKPPPSRPVPIPKVAAPNLLAPLTPPPPKPPSARSGAAAGRRRKSH